MGELPEPPATVRPAVAAKGFRPFFLLASAFAVVAMTLWLHTLHGGASPSAYLDATSWHAHEMLFGYSGAVIAGFLLTAVGNWTQQETLVGKPLLALAALWVAGRAAMASHGLVPPPVVAAIDLAFLPALGVAIGRPLLATGNRRNFVMLGVLGALWLANLTVHLDALGWMVGWRRRGTLLALDIVAFLLVLMAGRLVPMFTRNATGVQSIRSAPALDRAAAGAMALVALIDLVAPGTGYAAVAAAVAFVPTVACMVPWGGWHARRVPLLWILHLGYAWVPVALALRALGGLWPAMPAAVATHALTVGAIGGLTLGMITRVSLGHSGRPLVAPRALSVAFALVGLAALVRVVVPLVSLAHYQASLYASGALFVVAFGAYFVAFYRALTTPRPDGKPG